ncbi:Glycosyl transferase group 1 [Tepidanaerobacter acetatoxydans Re1]|uniref:Glycosyl transferase group 1 n=1 Tax=Tepidanaerobacter acetatoxydans (strain DSM 21804 / JCM 16047 / Re1) TaxID=1209989 RepID=F4LX96_TEPAE|nr:glycosyltransferase family 1 protein [Tepidanaerobacter acetatoxydans]AEE91895.1 glycosyl transferase group 1 [Tepidanaerobacter acetatoxydans Re1]CDI40847.1 Glycosyl transferase group 1 [Tepidanaerobacter acetatoxydans Re1]
MKEQIRILHIVGNLNRGGAETMIMNLYRNIDRSKFQFDFVKHTSKKCDYDDEISELGGRIFSISKYTGKNYFSYKKEWDTLFKNHPEYKILHGHIVSTAAIYIAIAKNYGVITIAHSHSTASRGSKIEQLIKNIMQIPIKSKADYLLACSNQAGSWLFGKRAITGNNYKIVKNAIDVEKYVFNESNRNNIRKSLGIKDKFVVGHVGSFTYPKNHKFLIDIFYQLQIKNRNSVLLLVGDGELRPQIEKQIERLGIKDKVILTGAVSNVNDYLQAMDVFVFPSISEGLGIAAIEAQTAGLPCILSDKIPQEAFVTDSVEELSLKADKKIWVEKILHYCNNYIRKNNSEDIKRAGYDIKESAREMERFYLEVTTTKI